MLYYDYILTFKDEVHYFWRRGLNSVTILFFVSRYMAVIGNIPVIFMYFWEMTAEVCYVHISEYPSYKKIGVRDSSVHQYSVYLLLLASCNLNSKYYQVLLVTTHLAIGGTVFQTYLDRKSVV